MDSTSVDTPLCIGHPDHRTHLYLGISKIEGWDSHKSVVYCWNISTFDDTCIHVWNSSTSSALYPTRAAETYNKDPLDGPNLQFG